MIALSMKCISYRRIYLVTLGWSFAILSSARILAYLPTIWSIHQAGDASQHSLWTWAAFFGSNLTMAAWLYEESGHRLGRAIVVNLCNALLCSAIVALIVWYRR
jgi:hypothetical protein